MIPAGSFGRKVSFCLYCAQNNTHLAIVKKKSAYKKGKRYLAQKTMFRDFTTIFNMTI